MGCIEALQPEVLLARTSFKEARDYIEANTQEVHYVDPGFKLFGEYLIGVPPIAIGVKGDALIFPYTKPCHGTFVLKLEDRDEVEMIRSVKAKELKKSMKRRGR